VPALDDPALDDHAWLVLHEVRLRGFLDLDNDTITTLTVSGFVQRSSRGVRVTTEGRVAHSDWARFGVGTDDETVARRAYERFLPLNRELIRICNDWQVRPGGVPNDHCDPRYDWAVVDRLRDIDDRAAPVIRRVTTLHARFARYRPALRAALERVDEGDTEWFTSPRCDSYHTVWMQFHEDLLLALGADRADEADD
jgi:hypothetical protein